MIDKLYYPKIGDFWIIYLGNNSGDICEILKIYENKIIIRFKDSKLILYFNREKNRWIILEIPNINFTFKILHLNKIKI